MKLKTLLLLVPVALFTIIGCTFAKETTAPAETAMTPTELKEFFHRLKAGERQTVVVYGTSLTEGGAWTGELRYWFDKHYPGQVKFVNSGLSGKNSDDGLAQLKAKVLDRTPDLVFIEFSINDAHSKFNLPVEKAAQNLDKIVQSTRAQNPKVAIILQVMNPPWDAPNGNKSASNRPQLQAYNDNYRNYAREHNMLLLDHWVNWQKLQETDPEKFKAYLPDGTHPTKDGSLAITWPLVRTTLEQARKDANN